MIYLSGRRACGTKNHPKLEFESKKEMGGRKEKKRGKESRMKLG